MDKKEAIRIWLEEREKHSLATKRYKEFRKRFKAIDPSFMTVEQFQEFLDQKDAYSEACKARNKAEIEFTISVQSPNRKDKGVKMADMMRIFDKATKISRQEPTATDFIKQEKQQESKRQVYGTFGDPAFEEMRKQALIGLGFLPKEEEPEVLIDPLEQSMEIPLGELRKETPNEESDNNSASDDN